MYSRTACALCGFGAAVALFLFAGFNKYIQGVDVHPERHLTARDAVALQLGFRLINTTTSPGTLSAAKRDKIMVEAYRWANSFLRVKAKHQAKIRTALDLVPGYFTTHTAAQKKALYMHEIGDPGTFFNSTGSLVLDEMGGK